MQAQTVEYALQRIKEGGQLTEEEQRLSTTLGLDLNTSVGVDNELARYAQLCKEIGRSIRALPGVWVDVGDITHQTVLDNLLRLNEGAQSPAAGPP